MAILLNTTISIVPLEKFPSLAISILGQILSHNLVLFTYNYIIITLAKTLYYGFTSNPQFNSFLFKSPSKDLISSLFIIIVRFFLAREQPT